MIIRNRFFPYREITGARSDKLVKALDFYRKKYKGSFVFADQKLETVRNGIVGSTYDIVIVKE